MNNKERMLQILKDTTDYYDADPANRRSVDKDGNCKYTWGDTHCAIGRYLKEEYQRENWIENDVSVNQLSQIADTDRLHPLSDAKWGIDWCLRDNMQGLDLQFWIDLQDMHDIVGYWEEYDEHEDGRRKYGLTDRGKEKYVAMQDKIARGEVYDD